MSTRVTNTQSLAIQLMACQSITPDDGGCQAIISERLARLGFTIQGLTYGSVSNLWARLGDQPPLFVFAGHTDVVPPGPYKQWLFPPFQPTVHEGFLYGRGAVDMKGGLAAMITACETFLQHNAIKGSIGFIITSDEEGEALNGTKKVVEYLRAKHEKIDYCLVGEPTSSITLGDTLRVGRRGSLNAKLTLYGKQGHTAFGESANNVIYAIIPFMRDLSETQWHKINQSAPWQTPTSTTLAFSNIGAGTGASNVIPGELTLQFNFRYAHPITADLLKCEVHRQLAECFHEKDKNFHYTIEWHHSAKPFQTQPGKLQAACIQAVQTTTNKIPDLSTGGGTSDGRFIVELAKEVIELGLCNSTIHQVNERVKVSDLDLLQAIYHRILSNLLT